MQRSTPTKVAIVGEEPASLTLSNTLIQEGYTVHQADEPTAELLIANQRVDLVIVRLSTLEELAICQTLQSGLQGGIPVILVCESFCRTECRTEGLKVGGAACLTEPIEGRELLAQVTRLLRMRQVEVALRASEQRFRLATEAMKGLVYEWDVSGRLTRRSVGMAEFLGWRPEEVPTHSDWWPQQIHPEDTGSVHRHFGEAVATRANHFGLEYRIRHKDGHYVWVWDNNRIVYDEDGKAVRVIGCAVSVDERKRAEQELLRAKEELHRANGSLEIKVERRTKKLLEMVAELESWSYSIAHDMRAPLRTMHNFSNFLLEEYSQRLDAIGLNYLERIDAATQRLDNYLRDLLHYGKMGRGELPLREVDTTTLIDEILATYPNLQPPKCEIKVKTPLPKVQANASALTQVFSNLLGNAVKFVKENTLPEVWIWAEEKPGVVRLWVEDNGIGIERQAQERLFGMFQRLHPSSDYEGTGMGLAIVRRAVDRMNGAVGVESAPNQGSRFWVELKSV
jgi:PAS domain S-box-containing protein